MIGVGEVTVRRAEPTRIRAGELTTHSERVGDQGSQERLEPPQRLGTTGNLDGAPSGRPGWSRTPRRAGQLRRRVPAVLPARGDDGEATLGGSLRLTAVIGQEVGLAELHRRDQVDGVGRAQERPRRGRTI